MFTNQELRAGTLLQNKYRIERVLGQGGYGITYLATDLSLNRLVAIKEFYPKDYCNRDAATSNVSIGTDNTIDFVKKLKKKFLKEALNISKLNHKGIIRVISSFEENNTAYYVMDYIKGANLAEIVNRYGPLSVDKALFYIADIGDALEYVHSHYINHLDVKPANILVSEQDKRPVLIDFGLSKQYDAEGHQTSTTPIGVSHGFAPMEQYKDGGVKEFSPQTDIYSLGATFYFILTGIVPPQAPTLLDEDLFFPPSVPERFVGPILKAMARSRKDRYNNVREFIHDILYKKASGNTTIINNSSQSDTIYYKRQSETNTFNKRTTAGNNYANYTPKKSYSGIILPAIITVLIAALVIVIFQNRRNNTGNNDSIHQITPREHGYTANEDNHFKLFNNNNEVISFLKGYYNSIITGDPLEYFANENVTFFNLVNVNKNVVGREIAKGDKNVNWDFDWSTLSISYNDNKECVLIYSFDYYIHRPTKEMKYRITTKMILDENKKIKYLKDIQSTKIY